MSAPILPVQARQWDAIAFIRTTSPDPFHQTQRLALINTDGTNLRFLTDTSWIFYGASISPDGSRIAFAGGSSRGAIPPEDIWLINRDGTGLIGLGIVSVFATAPTWTPDGRQILFTRPEVMQSWIVNADGTGAHMLSGNDRDVGPVMSPDGKSIVFRRFFDYADSKEALFLMDANGTNVRQLTPYSVINTSPAWAPDSRRIAFGHIGDDGAFLAVINADGTGMDRFGQNVPFVTDFSWRPDGKAIAYRSPVTGDASIYTMDLASGAVARLTVNAQHAADIWPMWSLKQ